MFNIGTVSRMTNILEATLRVWERRYGFPRATRTEGGHRLYSQEEIFRLQWVKTRMDEGMQVSSAIRALRSAEQDGAFVSTTAATNLPVRQPLAGTSLEHLQSRLLEALFAHHLDEVSLVLEDAQRRYPLEAIIEVMIGPTLQQIGTAWADGAIDVATEHLAANYLRFYLLAWLNVGPPSFNVNPVVLACAPGELHEGSLLMLGILLRRLRWPVFYLGQSVPLATLSKFLENVAPSVVVFAAMTEAGAAALVDWPAWLSQTAQSNEPIVCFGGRAFVEHPERISQTQGRYLGDTLQEGVQALDRLLHQLNPLLHAQ